MFVIEREVVHSENHAYEATKCSVLMDEALRSRVLRK